MLIGVRGTLRGFSHSRISSCAEHASAKLRQLSRNEVLRNVKNMPRVAIPRLRLPLQIQGYLLYKDIDVDVMIKEYKDTIDHINDNGISNDKTMAIVKRD